MSQAALSDQQRLFELRQEQWRRLCRRELVPFAIHALASKDETPARHHRRICAELEAVAHREVLRLMMLAPPGSAKTTYTSRMFPAWYFATHPHSNVIAASHTAELAETNSAYVQRYIRDNADVLDYGLRNDNKSNWETSNDCRYRAIGVGGSITGFRADVVILDDPIRGRADAESAVSREHIWSWFNSDLLTRLKPHGAIILIATPYHEDDLMGRLLRMQGEADAAPLLAPSALSWRVLRLPAIAEESDALGRAEGEPLWADDAGYGYGARLLALRDQYEREGLSRDWYSQYQCRPRPPEGALFKPAKMPIFDFVPGTMVREVRAYDLASSTKSTSDYTVALKLAQVQRQGDDALLWVITDLQRGRDAPEGVERAVGLLAKIDGYGVSIYLPEDPGQAGQSQVSAFTRLLVGYGVTAVRMTGSKELRAMACAAQANIGRIGMLKAPWNAALIDELGAFPNGRHDDQVDALSLAFDQLAANPPMQISREALLQLGINPDVPYRPYRLGDVRSMRW